MMKRTIILLLTLFIFGGLTACRTINNQDVGVVVGGVAGGLLGSTIGNGSGRVAAIVGGAAIGALVGGKIGSHMDQRDRVEVYETLERYPDGRANAWQNPNGNEYVVTPKHTYNRGSQPCREYQTTAIIGGKKRNVYGTACRMDDGSWKIQNG